MAPLQACSVELRCSAIGVVCGNDDRACQGRAVEHGLEISCERSEGREYVYCPPGGEQRDSNVVWILLATAVFVAACGGVIGYFVLRKRSSG
jgi:hypothetical protein